MYMAGKGSIMNMLVIAFIILLAVSILGFFVACYLVLSLYETVVELRERIAVLNIAFEAKLLPDPQYLADSLEAAAWPAPKKNALAEVREMHALEFGD